MFFRRLRNYFVGCAISVFILWAGLVGAEYAPNMRQGATPISQEVYDLHIIVLMVVVVINIIVFGIMFWSILHHRKSGGTVASQFHHSTTAEIIWSVIPIIILVGMAVPAVLTLIHMEETTGPDMTIKATGYHWKWKYDYMDEDPSFFSNLHKEYNDSCNGDSETLPGRSRNGNRMYPVKRHDTKLS